MNVRAVLNISNYLYECYLLDFNEDLNFNLPLNKSKFNLKIRQFQKNFFFFGLLLKSKQMQHRIINSGKTI